MNILQIPTFNVKFSRPCGTLRHLNAFVIDHAIQELCLFLLCWLTFFHKISDLPMYYLPDAAGCLVPPASMLMLFRKLADFDLFACSCPPLSVMAGSESTRLISLLLHAIIDLFGLVFALTSCSAASALQHAFALLETEETTDDATIKSCDIRPNKYRSCNHLSLVHVYNLLVVLKYLIVIAVCRLILSHNAS